MRAADAPAVRATLLGDWPGTDPVSAAGDVLNALGSPHLPVLPELPARGPGSDPVGRTAALLEDLAVDLQPHGWRLVPEPGMDHRRATSALASDRHALTDVAGESGLSLEDLLLRVTGPMSLAADLWLPGGERSLSDHGARRDVAQSLAAGLASHVAAVRSQTGASRLTVVLEEPRAAAVLSGALPTASGYRTVRSIPRSEVRSAWTLLLQSVLDAGATGLVLAPGRRGAGADWAWAELALLASEALPPLASEGGTRSATGDANGDGSGDQHGEGAAPMTALALPLAPLEGPEADPSRWEVVAGWTEAGRHVAVRLPAPEHVGTPVAPQPAGTAAVRPYRGAAVGLARAWERLGLDPARLGQLILAAPDLSAGTRVQANRTVEATVAAAEELDRIRQDGGLA
ncbi:hypothetical protein ABDK96_15055 [Citricoccus nitrophenolicus]|uniref:Uncharacterized protein n=1 Tax=Citricoccus nitrophenolicus TaxID=863575 RepID=A0ABV0ILF4_9MICC